MIYWLQKLYRHTNEVGETIICYKKVLVSNKIQIIKETKQKSQYI